MPAKTSATRCPESRVASAWKRRGTNGRSAVRSRCRVSAAIARERNRGESVSILTRCVAPAIRPRLLVFNQYYWPGVEATANLLTELCEALAETMT